MDPIFFQISVFLPILLEVIRRSVSRTPVAGLASEAKTINTVSIAIYSSTLIHLKKRKKKAIAEKVSD